MFIFADDDDDDDDARQQQRRDTAAKKEVLSRSSKQNKKFPTTGQARIVRHQQKRSSCWSVSAGCHVNGQVTSFVFGCSFFLFAFQFAWASLDETSTRREPVWSHGFCFILFFHFYYLSLSAFFLVFSYCVLLIGMQCHDKCQSALKLKGIRCPGLAMVKRRGGFVQDFCKRKQHNG